MSSSDASLWRLRCFCCVICSQQTHRVCDLSAAAFWGEGKANALRIYQQSCMVQGIWYPVKEGRDVCCLAIHHSSPCPVANALFFFPWNNAWVLLYREELLPSPPPQMVMDPWKCSFCGVQNKMERVILPEKSRQCLQLLVSTGHSRSQARQLGQTHHKGIAAEVRKPSQSVPMCQKHGDVPTGATGSSFLPCPTVVSSAVGKA